MIWEPKVGDGLLIWCRRARDALDGAALLGAKCRRRPRLNSDGLRPRGLGVGRLSPFSYQQHECSWWPQGRRGRLRSRGPGVGAPGDCAGVGRAPSTVLASLQFAASRFCTLFWYFGFALIPDRMGACTLNCRIVDAYQTIRRVRYR